MEKEMATHSSILAWRIPQTEEPGRLQSMESQRVGHDWVTSLSFWRGYRISVQTPYILFVYDSKSGIYSKTNTKPFNTVPKGDVVLCGQPWPCTADSVKPRKQLLCWLQNLPWLLPTHKSQPGWENVPQHQEGHHGCADGASWGWGFPQGCCESPAAVQWALRAYRCHIMGREPCSGMPQKAAAQDSTPLPDLCHSIMGKRLVGAQGQCAWSLCPSPTIPQSHPRPTQLLEILPTPVCGFWSKHIYSLWRWAD